ncbi:31861_t:CDS:2 [Gigaspora margarita]|uniref:31861_t:CDS:1 n=1 Tax=Gigaspora margarita TaxID=4874 RepID=A0ABN7VLK6_GIGMA|nr:31861_t:CDS:2 [Gigaspora margarita]
MAQYIDGILGAMIIHDPDNPYLKYYSYEYVVTLTNWYHQTSTDLLALFLAPGYTRENPVPDAGLISGKVQKEKRYRFRIIKHVALHSICSRSNSHKIKVIEVEANQVAKDYWIRATMSSECISNNGSSDKSPDSTQYTDDVIPCRNLDSKLIKRLTASPPKEATQTTSYYVSFGTNAMGVTKALMNHSSYVPDNNN